MVFLINGKFPADQLDLEEGDDVEVCSFFGMHAFADSSVLYQIVMKNSASQAIALHFHGIDQEGTPWSDGVCLLVVI
jgi:hypothetical protein